MVKKDIRLQFGVNTKVTVVSIPAQLTETLTCVYTLMQ